MRRNIHPFLLAVFCCSSVITAQTSSARAEPGPFLKLIESNFQQWDKDRDGTLTFNEIELAVADPTVVGPDAAAAATLRNLAKLRNRTLDEYRVDLTALEAGNKVNGYEKSFAAALRKLGGLNREIFPAGLPKGAQLAQGRLGDCFLLASLGTMAQLDPERLVSMVEKLPNDEIAVNFGNGQRVVLPAPTDAEVIIGSSSRGDGVWNNVFEKSIGHLYLARQKQQRRLTPYSIIGTGGTPNVPLWMLTGKKVVREGCEMFQRPGLDEAGKAARLDEIRNALESAFKEKRIVVGGTAGLKGTGVKVKGLYYNHSYGVLGYDRKTDIVTFWNPMSNGFKPKGEPGLENGYFTSYGRFECPLTEAVMWFGSFSIEQTERSNPE